MTLNEYIEQLQSFVEDVPSSGNLQVVYSSDEEGNQYSQVFYTASLGMYDVDEGSFISYDLSKTDLPNINAVCIN